MKLHRIVYGSLIIATSISPLGADDSQKAKTQSFPTFCAWQNACNLLPRFNSRSENTYQTPLHAELFVQEIDTFLMTMRYQIDKNNWINGSKPVYLADAFQAYAEKIILPTDAVIAIHGDLHGDVHSVNRFIKTCAQRGFLDEKDPFKITNKNFYMLFLGDYVDRGWYGSEVLYTILRLKNENPDNVFMVRGNHEDVELNSRCRFGTEMARKFSDPSVIKKINQVYNSLPVVFYLGTGKEGYYNIIQCCHGGIEVGFNPQKLLESKHLHAGITIAHLAQKSGFNHICCAQTSHLQHCFQDKPIATSNGFMWSDFIVDPHTPLALSPRDGFAGTMFAYGQSCTKQLLKAWSGKSYRLRSIFRAHQHGDEDMRNRILNIDKLSHPLDRGIGKLWIQDTIHAQLPSLLTDVAAVTFCVAPDTGFGWPIHSFGLLHVALDYTDWRLENIILPQRQEGHSSQYNTDHRVGKALLMCIGVSALLGYILYRFGSTLADENTQADDRDLEK